MATAKFFQSTIKLEFILIKCQTYVQPIFNHLSIKSFLLIGCEGTTKNALVSHACKMHIPVPVEEECALQQLHEVALQGQVVLDG
jgi:hypothetical protein